MKVETTVSHYCLKENIFKISLNFKNCNNLGEWKEKRGPTVPLTIAISLAFSSKVWEKRFLPWARYLAGKLCKKVMESVP